MGYEINWHVNAGDEVLKSPFYQKYSVQVFGAINPMEAKGDITSALASNESAAVINYLAWVVRIATLIQ